MQRHCVLYQGQGISGEGGCCLEDQTSWHPYESTCDFPGIWSMPLLSDLRMRFSSLFEALVLIRAMPPSSFCPLRKPEAFYFYWHWSICGYRLGASMSKKPPKQTTKTPKQTHKKDDFCFQQHHRVKPCSVHLSWLALNSQNSEGFHIF